ncbi:hypothetical protein KKG29_05665 [Patescibacteria group bacterium]|nr:hypothetical protein [Desulfobacteraceae bacterium]MBU4000625.1 hypothetical protein [Patescibacteria group bacterium]
MPKVTHESSWSEILEIYQAGNYESNAHLNAEAALKVKIAKSTIENQEAILEVQRNTQHTQGHMLRSQRGIYIATWILAFVTTFLFLATTANIWITCKTYAGAIEQVEAIKELSSAIRDIPKEEQRLKKSNKAHEVLEQRLENLRQQQHKVVKC